MKGGSRGHRLLRSRRSHITVPALLGTFLLALIIVIAIYSSVHILSTKNSHLPGAEAQAEKVPSGSEVLKIASIEPSIEITVNKSHCRGDYLGQEPEPQAQDGNFFGCAGGDRGERGDTPSKAVDNNQKDNNKASNNKKENNDKNGDNSTLDRSPKIAPGLELIIEASKTEGYEGDPISYRCTAVNRDQKIYYGLVLTCRGKIVTTSFLEPGKEFHLDDNFTLPESTTLSASVRGNDSSARTWLNNMALKIWKINPELKVKALAFPDKIHRGNSTSLVARIENGGSAELTDVTASGFLGSMGSIPRLGPGESGTLQRDFTLEESLNQSVQVTAKDWKGQTVYASDPISITVLKSSLNLTVEPSQTTVYPGQPAKVTWILTNDGEEPLRNVTLSGGYRLKEIHPGKTVRMEAIYTQETNSEVQVIAEGYDTGNYPIRASCSILIKSISPGLSLKATPVEVESCKDENANVTCLVSNTGNDVLTAVALYLNGTTVARLGTLSPGDFKVVNPSLPVSSNCTFYFKAQGRDTTGQIWSDASDVTAKVITTALRASATASPSQVRRGETSRLTCWVTNPSNIPLYGVFILSKAFGPIGSIDYLPPKGGRSISLEQKITGPVSDTIEVEGFTQDKKLVRDSCQLTVEIARESGSREEADIPNLVGLFEGSSMLGDGASGNKAAQDGNANATIIPEDNITVNASCGSTINTTEASEAYCIEPDTSDANSSGTNYSKEKLTTCESATVLAQGKETASDLGGILKYIEKMLQQLGYGAESLSRSKAAPGAPASDSSLEDSSAGAPIGGSYAEPNGDESFNDDRGPQSPRAAAATGSDQSNEYELSIESIKGSDQGTIKILNVGASPSQPPAGKPVKIFAHVKSSKGIKSAHMKWGISDAPLTEKDIYEVERRHRFTLSRDSGDDKDGYWGCTIPGKPGGTYMVISVTLSDGIKTVEDGPYLLHWSTVASGDSDIHASAIRGKSTKMSSNGMLFIESSVIKGEGEVSIKDKVQDNSIRFKEKIKAQGSINLESIRTLDKSTPEACFDEKRDMVFSGGKIKGSRSFESPQFHGGMGASITESFNLTHVDNSEMNSIRSGGSFDNAINFRTDQAFNGTWNIKSQYSKLFSKIKADQQYTGSFQTEKNITFLDQGNKITIPEGNRP